MSSTKDNPDKTKYKNLKPKISNINARLNANSLSKCQQCSQYVSRNILNNCGSCFKQVCNDCSVTNNSKNDKSLNTNLISVCKYCFENKKGNRKNLPDQYMKDYMLAQELNFYESLNSMKCKKKEKRNGIKNRLGLNSKQLKYSTKNIDSDFIDKNNNFIKENEISNVSKGGNDNILDFDALLKVLSPIDFDDYTSNINEKNNQELHENSNIKNEKGSLINNHERNSKQVSSSILGNKRKNNNRSKPIFKNDDKLVECHQCQIDFNINETINCSSSKCNNSYCFNCIKKYKIQYFDECLQCQNKCVCDRCTNRIVIKPNFNIIMQKRFLNMDLNNNCKIEIGGFEIIENNQSLDSDSFYEEKDKNNYTDYEDEDEYYDNKNMNLVENDTNFNSERVRHKGKKKNIKFDIRSNSPNEQNDYKENKNNKNYMVLKIDQIYKRVCFELNLENDENYKKKKRDCFICQTFNYDRYKFKCFSDFIMFCVKHFCSKNFQDLKTQHQTFNTNFSILDEYYKKYFITNYHYDSNNFKNVKYVCSLCIENKMFKEDGFFELYNLMLLSSIKQSLFNRQQKKNVNYINSHQFNKNPMSVKECIKPSNLNSSNFSKTQLTTSKVLFNPYNPSSKAQFNDIPADKLNKIIGQISNESNSKSSSNLNNSYNIGTNSILNNQIKNQIYPQFNTNVNTLDQSSENKAKFVLNNIVQKQISSFNSKNLNLETSKFNEQKRIIEDLVKQININPLNFNKNYENNNQLTALTCNDRDKDKSNQNINAYKNNVDSNSSNKGIINNDNKLFKESEINDFLKLYSTLDRNNLTFDNLQNNFNSKNSNIFKHIDSNIKAEYKDEELFLKELSKSIDKYPKISSSFDSLNEFFRYNNNINITKEKENEYFLNMECYIDNLNSVNQEKIDKLDDLDKPEKLDELKLKNSDIIIENKAENNSVHQAKKSTNNNDYDKSIILKAFAHSIMQIDNEFNEIKNDDGKFSTNTNDHTLNFTENERYLIDTNQYLFKKVGLLELYTQCLKFVFINTIKTSEKHVNSLISLQNINNGIIENLKDKAENNKNKLALLNLSMNSVIKSIHDDITTNKSLAFNIFTKQEKELKFLNTKINENAVKLMDLNENISNNSYNEDNYNTSNSDCKNEIQKSDLLDNKDNISKELNMNVEKVELKNDIQVDIQANKISSNDECTDKNDDC